MAAATVLDFMHRKRLMIGRNKTLNSERFLDFARNDNG